MKRTVLQCPNRKNGGVAANAKYARALEWLFDNGVIVLGSRVSAAKTVSLHTGAGDGCAAILGITYIT